MSAAFLAKLMINGTSCNSYLCCKVTVKNQIRAMMLPLFIPFVIVFFLFNCVDSLSQTIMQLIQNNSIYSPKQGKLLWQNQGNSHSKILLSYFIKMFYISVYYFIDLIDRTVNHNTSTYSIQVFWKFSNNCSCQWNSFCFHWN